MKDCHCSSGTLLHGAMTGMRTVFRQRSGDDLFDHSAVHIGQPKISTAVAVGQFFVIQTHQMQDGGVQVVNMHFVFDSGETEFIRCTVSHAPLDASTGQPHGKTMMVVIATVTVLGNRRATEFPPPDNQRVLQEIALF